MDKTQSNEKSNENSDEKLVESLQFNIFFDASISGSVDKYNPNKTNYEYDILMQYTELTFGQLFYEIEISKINNMIIFKWNKSESESESFECTINDELNDKSNDSSKIKKEYTKSTNDLSPLVKKIGENIDTYLYKKDLNLIKGNELFKDLIELKENKDSKQLEYILKYLTVYYSICDEDLNPDITDITDTKNYMFTYIYKNFDTQISKLINFDLDTDNTSITLGKSFKTYFSNQDSVASINCAISRPAI
jgi:hypothetical protein